MRAMTLTASQRERLLKLLRRLEWGPTEWHGPAVGLQTCRSCLHVRYVKGGDGKPSGEHALDCEMDHFIEALDE